VGRGTERAQRQVRPSGLPMPRAQRTTAHPLGLQRPRLPAGHAPPALSLTWRPAPAGSPAPPPPGAGRPACRGVGAGGVWVGATVRTLFTISTSPPAEVWVRVGTSGCNGAHAVHNIHLARAVPPTEVGACVCVCVGAMLRTLQAGVCMCTQFRARSATTTTHGTGWPPSVLAAFPRSPTHSPGLHHLDHPCTRGDGGHVQLVVLPRLPLPHLPVAVQHQVLVLQLR